MTRLCNMRNVAALLCSLFAAATAAAAGFMQGVEVDDDVRAALESRDPAALTRQAARLEHGESIARSVDGAISLYCLAARAGHAEAQYALGWVYANGRGVARNDALAAAWFQLAAEGSDPHAARMLRRLGASSTTPARCLLVNGEQVLPPLQSVPNPNRALVVYWVRQLAPRAGLDPNLVLSVIEIESAFNARARSPKNARGLMQLLPSTARRFGTQNEWDPLDNIRGGIAYLEWLHEQFDGNMRLVLAGYNAGEGAVRRYGDIPPYKETQNYVRAVGRVCRRASRGRHDFTAGEASLQPKLAAGLALLEPGSARVGTLASCPSPS